MEIRRADTSAPVQFTHGSHSLEVVWTILPAATLLFIAIYQMNAWADVKIAPAERSTPTRRSLGPAVRMATSLSGQAMASSARATMFMPSTICTCRSNEDILVDLKSMDVLHSFFLPNLRVKQDAVPGMKIPVWFRADGERHIRSGAAPNCAAGGITR